MIKLPISKLFSLIFLLILIKTNALGNNFLFDKNGKLFIETSNSGFIFHKNFMSQNKHNFDYIKDHSKSRSGNYYQKFELRNGDCFGDENWSDCDNDRQRIEFTSEPNQPIFGKQCYGYSIKLSNNFTDIKKVSTTLGQIHQKGWPVSEKQIVYLPSHR